MFVARCSRTSLSLWRVVTSSPVAARRQPVDGDTRVRRHHRRRRRRRRRHRRQCGTLAALQTIAGESMKTVDLSEKWEKEFDVKALML